MNISTSNEYYINKKALFTQCLNLSKELISSLDDWEALSDILSRREEVIEQLKELEASTNKAIADSLSVNFKNELDEILKRILDTDRDATNLMRQEQQNIKDSLKTNTQGQKLIQYSVAPGLSSGRLLDYKK